MVLTVDRRRGRASRPRSEEHTSELQSLRHLVCRLLLEKKKNAIRMVLKRINELNLQLKIVMAIGRAILRRDAELAARLDRHRTHHGGRRASDVVVPICG